MRRGIRGFVQIKCNTIILVHDCLISHDIFASPVTSVGAPKNLVVMEFKTTSDVGVTKMSPIAPVYQV
jgi:hypothetical protein